MLTLVLKHLIIMLLKAIAKCSTYVYYYYYYYYYYK